MKIGILEAGKVGAALAGSFPKLKHTVQVANSRGPETLSQSTGDNGATAVSLADVAKGVDLLVPVAGDGAEAQCSEKNLAMLIDDAFQVLPRTNQWRNASHGHSQSTDKGIRQSGSRPEFTVERLNAASPGVRRVQAARAKARNAAAGAECSAQPRFRMQRQADPRPQGAPVAPSESRR